MSTEPIAVCNKNNWRVICTTFTVYETFRGRIDRPKDITMVRVYHGGRNVIDQAVWPKEVLDTYTFWKAMTR